MSESLEERLDRTLRQHRRHWIDAGRERDRAQRAIDTQYQEHARRAERFHSVVRAAMDDAVAHANRHFAAAGAACALRDVSGSYTGPLYRSGSVCNPIACEFECDGWTAAETLVVELTPAGRVEAFLAPWRPPVQESDTGRIDLGWRAVLLDAFSAGDAADILVRYVTHVSAQCSRDWLRAPVPGVSIGPALPGAA